MVRRTKEEAQATRRLILDTAEVVFHERGVSRSSLNDIAQAAGLTRGAIYWHFKDKADLFNAMMERVILPLEETALRSGDPALEDPLAYMRENFTRALQLTVNDPQVRRVFEIATHKVEYVGELTAVRDRHLATRDNCLLEAERGITLAMRRGQLSRRMPARAAALGLHALIDGLIQNWMLAPEAFDLVKVGTQVLDAYVAGLAVPK
ncbi:MAG TPA: TetR family transcriptional regulator [Rhizobacter sp.]|nr:TetR family transcriptional regulator [Rhizobacter sp.]